MYDRKRAIITARDCVRRFNEAADAETKDKVLIDYLLVLAERAETQGLEFASAGMSHFVEACGSLPEMVRVAARHRADPRIGVLLGRWRDVHMGPRAQSSKP